MDEVLISGLPFRFIVRNIADFKTDDLMNYAAKKMFWNYRYRPKAEVVIARLEHQERGLRVFRQFKAQTANALHNNRGSVPFQFQGIPAQNEDFLLQHAKNTWNDFFRPFRLSSGQMNFTEKTIQILRAEGIPTLLLWARVQKNLRNMKESIVVTPAGEPPKTVRSLWAPRIQAIADKYSVRFVDMNYGPTIACDHFYDSSHLAQVCFPEFTDFIMKEIQTVK
ncbi:MAG: DUF1574 domain-containing protein [Spirochaetia bacterium]|nr:DUF1574 domain-containing protein [Spirochaetia bacterium]